MPIYEYVCNDCGHEMEVLQKMSDPLLETCPACTKNTLIKKVSAAAFHLKGTGWYKTDFADKKTDTKAKTKEKTPAPSCATGKCPASTK
jgi:putative FmdB family regulatory protein